MHISGINHWVDTETGKMQNYIGGKDKNFNFGQFKFGMLPRAKYICS